jgi:hypothetical protein|tara:strand:+ start:970 stop:1257 length:288 start_codon:yes stop_codon:yes gene_type:complete
MAVETATRVSQLVTTNPANGDPVSEGGGTSPQGHLNLIKSVLQGSFPSTTTAALIPSFVSDSGKFLTNNGTDTSWGTPTAGDPAGTGVAMAIALG